MADVDEFLKLILCLFELLLSYNEIGRRSNDVDVKVLITIMAYKGRGRTNPALWRSNLRQK